MDIALAGPVFIATLPLTLLAMALIYLEDRHSPIFRQERVGKDEAPIEIMKLRSMSVDTPDVASADAGAVTVTKVGKVVRRLNVDELPQLICILRGDMSVVGPRPALASQEDLMALRRENGSAALKPGLTGLAQIRSYDGMPPEEKAKHDGEYARRASVKLDIEILIRTVGYLFRPPPQY